MEKYLEGEEISADELRQALRTATLQGQAVPVLCGAALRNKGVQPVLDAVVDYLPSPLDVPPMIGVDPHTGKERACRASESEPFAALAFKVVADPYVGRLVYLRVYSGRLKLGSAVLNSVKGRKERTAKLLRMYANRREEVETVEAGDIAAALGLEGHFHRRDAVRFHTAGGARVDQVSRARHLCGHRASDPGRPGKAE